jgi:hypothetical protein
LFKQGGLGKNFLKYFLQVLEILRNPCYAKPCVKVNGDCGGQTFLSVSQRLPPGIYFSTKHLLSMDKLEGATGMFKKGGSRSKEEQH